MAEVIIDSKPISELIDDFRKMTEKNSVTPESVGYILQRIADLLSTAGSAQSAVILQKWYDNIRFSAPYIAAIAQNTWDRNHVFLDQAVINITTGVVQTQVNAIQIQQATTERAGAMRAQQVTDLNNCRRSVASLETAVTQLQNAEFKETITTISNTQGNSYIRGKAYRHGSLCTVVGELFMEAGTPTMSVSLPYNAASKPEIMIYDEENMQWVKIRISSNGNEPCVFASIPEDFLQDAELYTAFSLTYPVA